MEKFETVERYHFNNLAEMFEFLKSNNDYRTISYSSEEWKKKLCVLTWIDKVRKTTEYIVGISAIYPGKGYEPLDKYFKADGTIDNEQFAKDYDIECFVGEEIVWEK